MGYAIDILTESCDQSNWQHPKSYGRATWERQRAEKGTNMLGAGIYPITLAEMESYSIEADNWFKWEEHERLKEFLAMHPEFGDLVAGTCGIRILRWPLKRNRRPMCRVMYFFRDLNMPLYLLALYRQGERIDLSARRKKELAQMVTELVEEHSVEWLAKIIRQKNGG